MKSTSFAECVSESLLLTILEGKIEVPEKDHFFLFVVCLTTKRADPN